MTDDPCRVCHRQMPLVDGVCDDCRPHWHTDAPTWGLTGGNGVHGTVNLSNPRAIFAGSPPRFTRSRVTYEAYVVSRTSTRPQVDSAFAEAFEHRGIGHRGRGLLRGQLALGHREHAQALARHLADHPRSRGMVVAQRRSEHLRCAFDREPGAHQRCRERPPGLERQESDSPNGSRGHLRVVAAAECSADRVVGGVVSAVAEPDEDRGGRCLQHIGRAETVDWANRFHLQPVLAQRSGLVEALAADTVHKRITRSSQQPTRT